MEIVLIVKIYSIKSGKYYNNISLTSITSQIDDFFLFVSMSVSRYYPARVLCQ